MEEIIFYESTDNIKLCGLLSVVNDNKINVIHMNKDYKDFLIHADKTIDNVNNSNRNIFRR